MDNFEIFETPSNGQDEAIESSKTRTTPPRPTNPSQEGGDGHIKRAIQVGTAVSDNPASAGDAGHGSRTTHFYAASVKPTPQGEDRAISVATPNEPTPDPETATAEQEARVLPRTDNTEPPAKDTARQTGGEAQFTSARGGEAGIDARFSDPLIGEIVELYRRRQDLIRARCRLDLQAQSICRRFCDGDKVAGAKFYSAAKKGKTPETMAFFDTMLSSYVVAMQPLTDAQKAVEKELTKLAKKTPIYEWSEGVKGLGALSVAAIIGECGDISKYRSVSAVWKRAGLAVIDGGRQRRVAGDAALLHGYSPSRRSAFYIIGANLMRSQGEDGPYRLVYDERKAYELARDIPKGHAHNRAARYMTKRLIRHMYSEWKKVSA